MPDNAKGPGAPGLWNQNKLSLMEFGQMNVQPADHANKVHPFTRLEAQSEDKAHKVHAQTRFARPDKLDATEPAEVPAESVIEPEATPATAIPETDGAALPGDTDAEKIPGVLRLLEAGHFKGVADVRLRINFFEQLAARASATATTEVQSRTPGFLEAVNAKVDELVSSFALDEESLAAVDWLREEFDAAVQTAVEEFAPREPLHQGALPDAIQTAFAALVDGLRNLLAPTTETPVTEPPDASATVPDLTDIAGEVADGGSASVLTDATVPAETITNMAEAEPEQVSSTPGAIQAVDGIPASEAPPQTEAVDEPSEAVISAPADGEPIDPDTAVETALASLTSLFNDLLSELLQAADMTVYLPDPSEPSGNGVAYDKFLDIYNELRGISSEVNEVI